MSRSLSELGDLVARVSDIYAERNNIVVLYPQAQNTEGVSGISGNPSGCWDWWGYNGAGYWRKDAPQIRIIWKFVEALNRR